MPPVEWVIDWIGSLVAFATFGTILAGIWRGIHRPAVKTTGLTAAWLRSPMFYLLATTLFIVVSVALWRPLPVMLSPQAHNWTLAFGALAYFPGMLFVLWGRLALGKMYFVSTSFAAPLFAHHRLVTHGPYTIVRHPMYLGLMLAAFGSLLIYQTWTTAMFVIFVPFLLLRARREEQALAAEFGEQWQEYQRVVPGFFPNFWPIIIQIIKRKYR